ncbi:MAG TPA: hypothetical protein VGP68_16050 [Gemmataceae bacterium]|nr:hypothetical protein [Gemmataceae bacterium]
MSSKPDIPDRCPACGKSSVASIEYGEPHLTPELQQKLKQRRVVLGGCCISEDDPEWECVECRHRWGQIKWPDPPTHTPG